MFGYTDINNSKKDSLEE